MAAGLTTSDNFDQFIKFINMLMSDTTFHLEESLTSLTKIHQTRNMMANTAEWEARPEAERKDLLAQMQQAEGSAPFHTQMGRDHVELIEKFTATTKEPFLAAEIVERLAAVSRLVATLLVR
jgi:ubiquitin conjugation factor E4 B